MSQGVTPAAAAPVPPHNLEAEEMLLGALLLAANTGQGHTVLANVHETGVAANDFYRPSHTRVYTTICALHAAGRNFDRITVEAELRRTGQLDKIAGKDLTGPAALAELAALSPTVGNAPHWARLITDVAAARHAFNVAARLHTASLNGGVTPQIAADLQQLIDHPTGRQTTLTPLWLNDAIHEPVPDTAEYVEGVLETGVLADIVGLPYLHKSAVALELAVKVAKGRGLLLGKYAIKAQAKVAYFWADDSRPQELKRIQSYAAANSLDQNGRRLPVAFYLNPGVSIPDDLPAIKRQIKEHGFRLVVFDSLYNFADFDFVKDTGAVKHLYTALKRLCDDIEGLTIVLVDHASKPSDSNRDRDDSITSFGSVWKAAAVRCSIVVTKKGKSLFVSATGNNVKGFPRTPAYFNQERLELALAEDTEPDPERETRLEDLVLDFVQRNPGKSTNWIQRSVKGRNADIKASLVRLEAAEMILDTYKNTIRNGEESPSQPLGTTPDGLSHTHPESPSQPDGTKKGKTAWIPLNKAKGIRPDHNGTTPDEPRPDHGSFRPESPSQTPSPYVVGGGAGTDPEESPGTQPDDPHPLPNPDPDEPDFTGAPPWSEVGR